MQLPACSVSFIPVALAKLAEIQRLLQSMEAVVDKTRRLMDAERVVVLQAKDDELHLVKAEHDCRL